MHALATEWDAAAFKLYPLWGPDGRGYALDDDTGLATLESALAVGLRRVAVHKGLPLAGTDPAHVWPRDVGPAAHLLGKLLLHLGEDRILWGTDAIGYGSPQDQIQAFRAFEIGERFQERYGYPALTPERKAKILG